MESTLRLELLSADAGRPNPQLAIDVIDTGVGLDPENSARIFQAFSQADASLTRRHGGTGLGLTISRALARLLGGDITVESSSAGGTVFRAAIATGPLDGVRMVESATGGALRPTTPAMARPAFRELEPLRGRILLAEDGPDNQALISSILRRAGLDVDLASDGQIACEKMLAAQDAGEPYDLIVMDMQMPLMTGYEATAALRRDGVTIPILALTAQAMAGDRDKCLAAGCDEYLSKPIDRGRLLGLVRELLEKRGRGARGVNEQSSRTCDPWRRLELPGLPPPDPDRHARARLLPRGHGARRVRAARQLGDWLLDRVLYMLLAARAADLGIFGRHLHEVRQAPSRAPSLWTLDPGVNAYHRALPACSRRRARARTRCSR